MLYAVVVLLQLKIHAVKHLRRVYLPHIAFRRDLQPRQSFSALTIQSPEPVSSSLSWLRRRSRSSTGTRLLNSLDSADGAVGEAVPPDLSF